MKSLRWRLGLFALLCFLCRIDSFAGAQGGQQPTSPGNEHLSPQFVQFKDSFEQTLGKVPTPDGQRADPQKNTLHFVILINTSHIQEPAGNAMLTLYTQILNHYLVENGDKSDMVSCIPFQKEVRAGYLDNSHNNLNLPFHRDQVSTLDSLKPTTRDESEGNGHNIEKAVEDAVSAVNPLESSVFVVLSDIKTSDTSSDTPSPTDDTGSTNQSSKVALVGSDEYYSQKTPGEPAYTVSWRIYTPKLLKPLGALPKSREEMLAPPPPTLPNNKPDDHQGASNAGGDTHHDPDKGFDPTLLALGVGVLVAVGLAGAYCASLYRLRVVLIDSVTQDVQFSKVYSIGNEDGVTSQIQLRKLPAGERIATLRVNWGGQVVLRGSSGYKLRSTGSGGGASGQITLQDIEQEIEASQSDTGSDITFVARLSR